MLHTPGAHWFHAYAACGMIVSFPPHFSRPGDCSKDPSFRDLGCCYLDFIQLQAPKFTSSDL
jgi:hypothetical protein